MVVITDARIDVMLRPEDKAIHAGLDPDTKTLAFFWSSIEGRVMRTENQDSASYADQSNYSFALSRD